MNLNIKYQSKNQEKVKITISGTLTILFIGKHMADIKKAVTVYNDFEIQIKNLEEMDLAGFQFLKSIKKEILNTKKTVKFVKEFKPEIIKLFQISGINLETEL